ncbi:MAG: DUF1559 domain-containing protein [Planctomycetota bacterium]
MSTPRTPARARATTPGFTLIELLVVISIIALLIGILLPALGAARSTARGAVCQSNMRMMGIAYMTYATDNRDFTAGKSTAGTSGFAGNPANAWMVNGFLVSDALTAFNRTNIAESEIYPYLSSGALSYRSSGTSLASAFQFTDDNPSTRPGVGVMEVMACPSDDFIERSSGISYSANSFLYEPRTTTFFNDPAVSATFGFQSGGGRGGSSLTNQFLRIDLIADPSELIVFVDEGAPNDNRTVTNPISRGLNDGLFEFMTVFPDDEADFTQRSSVDGDKPKWYHGDSASFSFADGHGELRQKDDPEITGYNGSETPLFEGRSFFGYGKLWDPLGQAPLDPTLGTSGGGGSRGGGSRGG